LEFDLETPALLVDETRMQANIDRLADRAGELGVPLRPHIKTAKSIDIARLLLARNAEGLTVSTLHEADYFAGHGISDLFYAVALVPGKVAHVARLNNAGADVKCLIDSIDGARQCAQAAADQGIVLPLVIEIDVDGHRAGIDPTGDDFATLALLLHEHASVRFDGVMSYGGHSYALRSPEDMRSLSDQHNAALKAARERLEAMSIPCPMTSFGSSPPLLWAMDLSAASELRAGVYTFWDVFQAGLGCCSHDEIALSVLTTVNGVYPDKNRLIVDAGALALSADRSTAGTSFDAGFGLVCDAGGRLIDDLFVKGVNQEHGLVTTRSGQPIAFEAFPIGSQLRILPNHACMTAAAYQAYHVVGPDGHIRTQWPRINHW
jgi:D-serine deaminase-like pyridoxal phosphate-dependent protein